MTKYIHFKILASLHAPSICHEDDKNMREFKIHFLVVRQVSNMTGIEIKYFTN